MHVLSIVGCLVSLFIVTFAALAKKELDGVCIILLICYPVVASSVSIRGVVKKRLIFLSLLIAGIITSIGTLVFWIACLISPHEISTELADLLASLVLIAASVISIKTDAIGYALRRLLQIKLLLRVVLLGSIWLSALLLLTCDNVRFLIILRKCHPPSKIG